MTLRTCTRVQLIVEVVGSSYGPEWNLGALIKQSNEEALQGLRNKLTGSDIKVIGEPRCLVHTIIEER